MSEKRQPTLPPLPGKEESQAILAAIFAAQKGDDKLAGDILRHLADTVLKSFLPKELKPSDETP